MTGVSPRKQPIQERSRATVDAILQAAGQVLATHGFAAATTHRIAERAGCSVGTLYQYFRKKEAVFAELQRRELNTLVENLVVAREEMRESPLDAAIERLVDVLLGTFTKKPQVARALAENRSQILDPEEELERHTFLQQLLTAGLREREEPLLIEDYELATFVIVKTSEAVSVAAVVERPEALKDGSLKRELAALFRRYLTGTQ